MFSLNIHLHFGEHPSWCSSALDPPTTTTMQSHAAGALAGMALFKYGRLSVQPVTREQWEFVLGLENGGGGGESGE